jgi:transposase
LTEARWISEGGRCAMAALLLAFHKRFDKAFRDERLRLLCSEPQYAAAALRAVLRPDRNVHPVWCVLFKWLADVAENTNVTPQRTVKAGQPKVRVGAEHELSVLSSAPSMRQASVTLGISINTSLRLARKFGISYKERPKSISESDKQRIINSLKTGRPVSEVAAVFKVSLSTVYRLLPSANESRASARGLQSEERLGAARENWLTTLENHPDSTVTHLRRKVAADWAYLYRHDRTWLHAHSPHRQTTERQRSREGHAVLLAVAAGAVADASEKCGRAESAPIRRSAYRLQTMSGLSDYQLCKLKSSQGVQQLSTASETHSSFVARRLQWVAAVDHDAVHATVWRVARRAGLRSCSITSLVNDQASFEASTGA